jgi:hypothetical protein
MVAGALELRVNALCLADPALSLSSGRGGLWLGLSHTGGSGSGRDCNRALAKTRSADPLEVELLPRFRVCRHGLSPGWKVEWPAGRRGRRAAGGQPGRDGCLSGCSLNRPRAWRWNLLHSGEPWLWPGRPRAGLQDKSLSGR